MPLVDGAAAAEVHEGLKMSVDVRSDTVMGMHAGG
jgi:hypothetical protein